jgi:hypothetical protein
MLFINLPNLLAALDPVIYSTSNKLSTTTIKVNQRPARKADKIQPLLCRLSRQIGIHNISQPFRAPRPDTGIALHVCQPLFHHELYCAWNVTQKRTHVEQHCCYECLSWTCLAKSYPSDSPRILSQIFIKYEGKLDTRFV